MSETGEWLEGLKPGDKVFHHGKYNANSILMVERVTKTQIICKDGDFEIKFKRSTGFNVGGDTWSRHYIDRLTDDKIAALRRQTLGRKAIELRKRIAIPITEDELISFIADMEKWVPGADKGGNA